MKTGKFVLKWMIGIIIAIGLIWIIMPFAFGYPFLYIKYCLNPYMTPDIMEKIIDKKPEDVYDIEKCLNKRTPPPRKNDIDFQPYMKRLERMTARYIEEGKLTSLHINRYHENKIIHKVKYIVGYETRTAWGRTKAPEFNNEVQHMRSKEPKEA